MKAEAETEVTCPQQGDASSHQKLGESGYRDSPPESREGSPADTLI